MNNKPQLSWDQETMIAKCEINYKGQIICGEAVCHPDDRDVASQYTGYAIAGHRALIKCLRFVRDFELKPQLKSLNQLYYSMKNSKHFNPKSYEAIMLYKQIHHLEKSLQEVAEEIEAQKAYIKEYIKKKENDFIKIRAIYAKRVKND